MWCTSSIAIIGFQSCLFLTTAYSKVPRLIFQKTLKKKKILSFHSKFTSLKLHNFEFNLYGTGETLLPEIICKINEVVMILKEEYLLKNEISSHLFSFSHGFQNI